MKKNTYKICQCPKIDQKVYSLNFNGLSDKIKITFEPKAGNRLKQLLKVKS